MTINKILIKLFSRTFDQMLVGLDAVASRIIGTPKVVLLNLMVKKVLQYSLLCQQQSALNCCKYDVVSIFTTQTQSVEVSFSTKIQNKESALPKQSGIFTKTKIHSFGLKSTDPILWRKYNFIDPLILEHSSMKHMLSLTSWRLASLYVMGLMAVQVNLLAQSIILSA